MIKVYVASSFLNKSEVLRLYSLLRSNKCEINFPWAEIEQGEKSDAECVEIAKKELKASREADIFILRVPGRLSTHAEFGLALGNKVPIIIYGGVESRENCIFYHLIGDDQFVSNDEELLEAINNTDLSYIDKDRYCCECSETYFCDLRDGSGDDPVWCPKCSQAELDRQAKKKPPAPVIRKSGKPIEISRW